MALKKTSGCYVYETDVIVVLLVASTVRSESSKRCSDLAYEELLGILDLISIVICTIH